MLQNFATRPHRYACYTVSSSKGVSHAEYQFEPKQQAYSALGSANFGFGRGYLFHFDTATKKAARNQN